jgi:signal recognition particle subunit SRP54
MAFEGLTEKLAATFKKLRGKGRLSENDVREAMREVRLALLEADVGYKVVKEFVAKVTERSIGTDVLDSLTPAQQVIKIVNEEMTALMGGAEAKITMASQPPTVVMMVGLQGSGKTTTTAKLASFLQKKYGKRPLLTACDVYRPAAIEQLQVVGSQVDLPVFEQGQGNPVAIAQEAVRHAKDYGNDIVFLDTAGRLHVDEALMDELRRMKETVHPNEILLVVDAMTGQDAVNAASAFDETLGIDGVVLTKLDGDARGGAALSIRATTGKPIKFVGTGEKLDMIEPFHPDRMASRILGMGDMLTLIEKAEQSYDEKQAAKLEQKLRKNKLTLQDYYEQLQQLRNMGDLSQLAGMMPGNLGRQLQGATIDEKILTHTEAIILSMTPIERENPQILNASRKKRIAAGCGLQVVDINRLLKQFDMMQQFTRQMTRGRLPRLGGKGPRGFSKKKHSHS